jgi:hypothetical protein
MFYLSLASSKTNLVSNPLLIPLIYVYLLGQSENFQLLLLTIAQRLVRQPDMFPLQMPATTLIFLYLILLNMLIALVIMVEIFYTLAAFCLI